jgi:serine protease inhibitor
MSKPRKTPGVAFWATVVVVVLALAPGCEPQEPTPVVVTADMTTVVEGNTDFARDLYRQVGKEPGNLFFSPSSLSTALAMTYAGARTIRSSS